MHSVSASFCGVSAVGTNCRVGDYLAIMAGEFGSRPARVQTQLSKAGMNSEECGEVKEALSALANRFYLNLSLFSSVLTNTFK